ncbi:hypothetical protein TNIN_336231 [Trichonephila inaurata madagascariensis]|uniref:Uncharacterized protein n=1 Tax=Trichonephila inaurata madagascariensis TaxID=2747483 RepID=A0A8X6YKU8_9ARAC|nr:hypothetical protein TNIN_336231 [Trichonephila inaurata madagascariensis]
MGSRQRLYSLPPPTNKRAPKFSFAGPFHDMKTIITPASRIPVAPNSRATRRLEFNESQAQQLNLNPLHLNSFTGVFLKNPANTKIAYYRRPQPGN